MGDEKAQSNSIREEQEAESARSEENEEIKDEENNSNSLKFNGDESMRASPVQSDRRQSAKSDIKIQPEENAPAEIVAGTVPTSVTRVKTETSSSSSSGCIHCCIFSEHNCQIHKTNQ
ncbi:unnamed protein product [Schistosoma turkestanicum]|nr:unnamed protein product [Schistosoma turkestanicum]